MASVQFLAVASNDANSLLNDAITIIKDDIKV
jgi:hypothetical protein